jgi:hypothetical protein
VSPGIAGPVERCQRMGESRSAAGGASQKGPAIRDGCQSREEPQCTSIRSNVVCRNSHTHRKMHRIKLHRKRELGPSAVLTIIKKPPG